MPLPKTSGMEPAARAREIRWAWLFALYLVNLTILGVVCIALMNFRVFNSLRHPWLCWLIGLADAEVALGVLLIVLGPGPFSIRIPLGIVLAGMGMVANGVVNHVDMQVETNTIIQIMFASVMHALILALSAYAVCYHRRLDFAPAASVDVSRIPWNEPIEAHVFDAEEPILAQPPEAVDQPNGVSSHRGPRYGIGHLLLATTAVAFVLALARTFLPEIDWNTVDWLAVTEISLFLWFDIAILCVLPLTIVVVGLWEEGQAQLVVATFAGIATCAVQVAMLGLFAGPGGSLPAELMIAIDFSRLLVLLANTSALRTVGVSLQR